MLKLRPLLNLPRKKEGTCPPPCDTYLYSQNRAAADYYVTIVQHHGLAACDGALRLIEFHFHLAVRQRAHGGGLLWLAVAGLGFHPWGRSVRG